MPFFSSLTYTGTRVGGQRERQTQSFEAGSAYFPRDYPFTDAYASYADKREQEDKGRWERKPPAKRANFQKLGTRSAWKPDWEVVLGLDTAMIQDDDDLLPTQREDSPSMVTVTKVRPWLLRGVGVPAILENVSNMFNHGAGLLAEMNKLRTKRTQDPLESKIRPDDLWKGALVMVQLTMCGRGAPDDLAVIYSINDAEARRWASVFDRTKKPGTALLDQENVDEVEVSYVAVSCPTVSFLTLKFIAL
jgi:ribonuclease P/MRP protein subunit POP1